MTSIFLGVAAYGPSQPQSSIPVQGGISWEAMEGEEDQEETENSIIENSDIGAIGGSVHSH